MNTVETFHLPEKKPDWASYGDIFLAWVRTVAPKYDIDIEKYALGFTLANIIGDDENCFGPFTDHLEELSHLYPQYKSNLIKRVSWESEVPELPEVIKERLRDFLPRLVDSDWCIEEECLAIRREWTENIRDFTENLIEHNDGYKQAVVYESEQYDVFRDEWQDITKDWRV